MNVSVLIPCFSLTKCLHSKRQTLLSVSAVHQSFSYISIYCNAQIRIFLDTCILYFGGLNHLVLLKSDKKYDFSFFQLKDAYFQTISMAEYMIYVQQSACTKFLLSTYYLQRYFSFCEFQFNLNSETMTSTLSNLHMSKTYMKKTNNLYQKILRNKNVFLILIS